MKQRIFLHRENLKEALQRPSSWVLIAVNLGLIAGAIFWDWRVFDIVFLYWVENLVIGVINVLKMMTANSDNASLLNLAGKLKPDSDQAVPEHARAEIAKIRKSNAGFMVKLTLIPFFMIHYGLFCYGHGIFVFAMFSNGGLTSPDSSNRDIWGLLTSSMLLAIGLLAASHLFSFFRNYIAAGEYRHTNPAALMSRPYGRIVALHITIIFGAFLTMAFGNPLGLLIVLMVLKTSVDLAMHQSERQKFQ